MDGLMSLGSFDFGKAQRNWRSREDAENRKTNEQYFQIENLHTPRDNQMSVDVHL
jgi:hypothetical protein